MLSTVDLEANSAECSPESSYKYRLNLVPLGSSSPLQATSSVARVPVSRECYASETIRGVRQYQDCIPESCVVASSAPGLTAAL